MEDINTIYALIAVILVLGGAVAIKMTWPHIKSPPSQSKIIKELLPLATLAVASAFSVSEKYYDSGSRIGGPAKKEAAMWLYNRLPEEIAGYDTEALKKTVLTERLFSQIIEMAYTQAEEAALEYLADGGTEWTLE